MSDFAVINDSEIESMMRWDKVISAVRQSLISITATSLEDDNKKGIYKDLKMNNPKRVYLRLPSKDAFMLCMPGYVEGMELDTSGIKEASLTCKILTIFDENTVKNPPLPTISGYIYLYNETNGKLQAVLGADVITEWRTAAVSCVATKLLWANANDNSGRKILAIMGAGTQGRIHAIALQNEFNFDEIRIWNRTPARGEKLVEDLKKLIPGVLIKFCKTGIECVQDADVTVTATPSVATIVQDDWVKAGSHINVVGVGPVSELSDEVYKRSDIYVESKDLTIAENPKVIPLAELGELMLDLKKVQRDPNRITVFQSRGMGIHDSAVARLVYNTWLKEKSIKPEALHASRSLN